MLISGRTPWGRPGRIGVVTLVSLLALSCSGGSDGVTTPGNQTQPAETIAANFVLETYRAQTLPEVAVSKSTYRIVINSGRMELRADRRYTERIVQDSIVMATGATIPIPATVEGNYLLKSGVLTFFPNTAPLQDYIASTKGTLSGNTLLTECCFNGFVHQWRKE